jgi:hypothetical protein
MVLVALLACRREKPTTVPVVASRSTQTEQQTSSDDGGINGGECDPPAPLGTLDTVGPDGSVTHTPLRPAKMDLALRLLYLKWEEETKDPNDGITITLVFCGALSSILALGVKIAGDYLSPGQITVTLKYSDLERILKHPGVISLIAGGPYSVDTAHAL